MGAVEEIKNELIKAVKEKYPGKSEAFYRVAEEIIETFGYVYPTDTELLIDRISQII